MKRVLILSTEQDFHVVPVMEHLASMGVHADALRYDDFSFDYQFTHLMGIESETSFRKAGKVLELNNYQSIWHRRPGQFSVSAFPEPWIARMVENETREAVTGILNGLPCVWVNLPLNDLRCGKKMYQLAVAQRVGFEIPETLVTNHPERVTEFFERCKGQVIYKLIGEVSGLCIPQSEMCGIPTLPLREFDLSFVDQVRFGPHLFQECIQKAYDIRVNVIGKKIFAGRIHSQTGEGAIDWRNDYSVLMEPISLPAEIENKCLNLMLELGLNYGAFDFCETADNRFIFIEINCSGQYLWLEERTGWPIGLELAKLLALESEPLILTL